MNAFFVYLVYLVFIERLFLSTWYSLSDRQKSVLCFSFSATKRRLEGLYKGYNFMHVFSMIKPLNFTQYSEQAFDFPHVFNLKW